MSRVILSRYPDGSDHVVVGWDHPAGGAFWQEWASLGEIAEAEKILSKGDPPPEVAWMTVRIAETGVKRDGGMWPGIPLEKLIESMPEELRSLMSDEVMDLLREHREDPDSGYNKPEINLA